jgi:hypothetical protein
MLALVFTEVGFLVLMLVSVAVLELVLELVVSVEW